MPVFERFSSRMRRQQNTEVTKLYRYDLPQDLRVQIGHIWFAVMSDGHSSEESVSLWRVFHNRFAKEMGLFSLDGALYTNVAGACISFLTKADDDQGLDMVDFSFQFIDVDARAAQAVHRLVYRGENFASQEPDDAIQELNDRLRYHAVGYEFIAGELRRIDSQFLHSEATVPAIQLLHDQAFNGASDEFLQAHKKHREGDDKGAIIEALKALESTAKSICDQRKWAYPQNATASVLIKTLFDHGLIPAWLETHYNSLRSVLESGVPTIRNKTSGHGQGSAPIDVPGYFVAYALHLTAASIVFLVEAHKAMK